MTLLLQATGLLPAATELGLSTSSVSRHIVNLEQQLGKQLFVRTTRHLHLTEAGEQYLTHCRRIARDVDNLLQAVGAAPTEPAGRLRITVPEFMVKTFVREVLAEYSVNYPRVRIDLVVVNRIVNLVEENFDLAIRVGELPDSTLIARKLLDMRLALVGSRSYLERNGEPAGIDDLQRHNCIVETSSPYLDRWPVIGNHRNRRFTVAGNIQVNSGEAARDFALGGAGLALLPKYMVMNDLQQGKLVTVLEQDTPDYGGVFSVYPQVRHLPPAVSSLVEHLVGYFRSTGAVC